MYHNLIDQIVRISAQELNGLEERSTTKMQSQMDGFAACVSVLIQSQVSSVAALHGLLNEGSNYARLRTQLETSLNLVKAAEERLRQSSMRARSRWTGG
jgi:hypothetical protein